MKRWEQRLVDILIFATLLLMVVIVLLAVDWPVIWR